MTVEAVTLLIEIALAREAIVTKAPVSTGTDVGTLMVGAATVTALAWYAEEGPVLPAVSVSELSARVRTAEPLEQPDSVTR